MNRPSRGQFAAPPSRPRPVRGARGEFQSAGVPRLRPWRVGAGRQAQWAGLAGPAPNQGPSPDALECRGVWDRTQAWANECAFGLPGRAARGSTTSTRACPSQGPTCCQDWPRREACEAPRGKSRASGPRREALARALPAPCRASDIGIGGPAPCRAVAADGQR